MTDRHEVVARLSRVVRSGLDPDRTLEAIGEAARELFAAPGASISACSCRPTCAPTCRTRA